MRGPHRIVLGKKTRLRARVPREHLQAIGAASEALLALLMFV